MNATNPKNKRRKITLTEKVIIDLRNDIQSGALKPGMMLPTEPSLTQKFGVSRTVIREAVAALKAEGLLNPRQGAGVFVLAPTKSNGSLFEFDNAQISDVLEILELRMAVEIEAASLACARCSAAHQAKIFEALQEMILQVEKGGSAVKADYEFHRAIAEATNNCKYKEFLEFLGDKTIPRAQLQLKPIESDSQTTYMSQILDEHHRIYEAIAMRDAKMARQAMRDHLSRSQSRYQSFLND
jgi:GntR family transcriptional repressor for pyruvate dehydrogenase complex